MDVWEKLDSLTYYLSEGTMFEELISYFTASQMEDAVEYIAQKNGFSFDDDAESEN